MLEDKDSQFEYGKNLFKKAVEYLKILEQNGCEESSEFLEEYIY